jgi:hypothetical protein
MERIPHEYQNAATPNLQRPLQVCKGVFELLRRNNAATHSECRWLRKSIYVRLKAPAIELRFRLRIG